MIVVHALEDPQPIVYYRCPNCKKVFPSFYLRKINFCPYCGYRFIEEEESEEGIYETGTEQQEVN